MIHSITITTVWIYTSQGKTALQFRWTVLSGSLIIASFAVGIYLGSIIAMAACYAATEGIILLYPNIAIPGRLIDMSFMDLLHKTKGVFACAAVMAFAVFIFGAALLVGCPHWLQLLLKTVVGVAIYGVLIHSFRLEAYLDLRSLLYEQWSMRIAGR